MTTKHTVTDSRGQTHKRVSQNRTYSHAIVTHLRAEPADKYGHARPARTWVRWSSRLDLAQKEASGVQGRADVEGVEIIEATIVQPGKKPYELEGRELAAYREGFLNGNESDYFPGGYATDKKALTAYDRGYKDGQKHGDRKGQPWTLEEILRTTR